MKMELVDVVVRCIIGFGTLIVGCYLVVQIANGDDNEDEVGLCMRGYESHCYSHEKQIIKIIDMINKVCEEDESLCVLGVPDPDLEDE